MKSKKELRSEFKAIRSQLQRKDELSEIICRSFLDTSLYKNCETLLCYYAVGSEVQCNTIIKTALYDGKKVALPVCLNDNGDMQFFYISAIDDLKEGMYSIPVPKGNISVCNLKENDICIVPALSFDKTGARLGYGKGYYDRFLSQNHLISVGVCFQACLSEVLPTEDNDKNVEFLITEKRIYKFKI